MTKHLTIAILALASTSALSAGLSAPLSASSESEFLAKAGSAWKAVGASRYENVDATGKRTVVAFGDGALQDDIASLNVLAESLQVKLLHATSTGERARLRNSIRETQKAIAALQQGVNHAKFSTFVTGSLNGCAYPIDVEATFQTTPGMVSHGGVLVEAFGPTFVSGPPPAVGTVTVTAIANGDVDTDSALIYGTFNGQAVSAYSAFADWGCELEARASIVPSCTTSGYRSVKWITTCPDIENDTDPTPVYGDLH